MAWRKSLWAASILAVVTAGSAAPAMMLITHGTPVDDKRDYTAVVGLTYNGERTPRCTGVLIEPDVVVSAGHCICEADANGFAVAGVFVGNDPTTDDPQKHGYYFTVLKWRTAYSCDRPEDQDGNDLAVLKLDRAVEGIRPVPIASSGLANAASTGLIVGFGATDSSGTSIDYRKEIARVPVVTNNCASADDGKKYGCQSTRELVAGIVGGPDTCFGDSGGPLLVSPHGDATSTNHGNDMALLGITSRSVINAPSSCSVGGIYERVDGNALKWITAAERALA